MYRKLLPIVLLIVILFGSASAQEKDEAPRGHLGILIGPSFPTGTFGQKNWDDDKSGYAVQGIQYSALDFGIKFIPNFGISAAFKGAYVPMDMQYIANKYSETYGGEFRVESTRWSFGGIFAGPFVSFPTKYIDIDFRLMPGLFIAFSPEIIVSRGTQTVMQESSIGPSIAISLSAGTRIHLSKRFSALVQVEYQTARPTFLIEQNDGNSFESVRAFQNINIFNVSGGIALRIFNKKK